MFRKLEISLTALTIVAVTLMLALATARPLPASADQTGTISQSAETVTSEPTRPHRSATASALTMPYFSFASMRPLAGAR
ncbi:MAG TPA: hypothetical protein DDZ76_04060 [Xanthomonadales bacterium]|nr:hypothetical protein [Xanthomonadales bacterium]